MTDPSNHVLISIVPSVAVHSNEDAIKTMIPRYPIQDVRIFLSQARTEHEEAASDLPEVSAAGRQITAGLDPFPLCPRVPFGDDERKSVFFQGCPNLLYQGRIVLTPHNFPHLPTGRVKVERTMKEVNKAITRVR